MASTKLYLDTRRASEGGYSLRINICQHTKTAAFNLGVKLAKNQWNATTGKGEKPCVHQSSMGG